MKAIILAGGLGERLRPFTKAIPKPLLPIGERSLLDIQIMNLARHGFDEITIATNYKSEYIQNFIGDGGKYKVRLSYSHETKPLGTCGPLSLLRKDLTEPFVLMNGDILSALDFAKFFCFGMEQDTNFTIATKNVITPFNFGKVNVVNNRIVRIEEKPDIFTEVVAGIYFMRPQLLELVPDDTYFGIDSLVSIMLADGHPIARYLMEEYWLDIGRIDDYATAEAAYEEHFKSA